MPDIAYLFIVLGIVVLVVAYITDRIEANLEKEYGRY